jgi:hypothetical protein
MFGDYTAKYLLTGLFALPSLPGPARFGGGSQFPPGRLRNNPFGFAGRRGRARRSSAATRSDNDNVRNQLRELFALSRQFFDSTINDGNRHFDVLSGIATS